MYSIALKESFKNLVLQQKKIVDMYLKNGDFHPASMASSALTRTLINKDPFAKEIALPIIFHMPYW